MRQLQGNPLPLGVTVTEDKINFAVAVPRRKTCTLLLYHQGEEQPFERISMQEHIGEVCFLAMDRTELSKCEYNYEIDGKVTVDPYVKSLAGKKEWKKQRDISKHEVRGIIDTEPYEWEQDQPLELPYHEIVAYSLHVRGYTKDSSSKVQNKGLFEGIIEKIPYLKELGINQIQCMPVYEFEECGEKCNYWGYGEAFYFAPKSSYSAVGDGMTSLKDMVKACHAAGIEVVLEMPFDAEISKQMMDDCLRYYRMEYHIDGFVLNPLTTPIEYIHADPILKSTKILKHQTDYQNIMRRYLKGDEGMVPEVIRAIRELSSKKGAFNYITTHTGFTLNDLVSYDGKHNESNGENNQDGTDYNFSWNCGAEGPTRRKDVLELRRRQIYNAFLLLLLSQGTPCILAGDEFGNSQKGNNNVYCQDNPIGWVNWNKLWKDSKLHDFVKALIQIRKTYGVFAPEIEMKGIDRVGCGIPDVSYHGENAWRASTEVSSRQIGVYYSGLANHTQDCFVAYNMHWIEHSFALPTLKKGKQWYMLISTDGVKEYIFDDQKHVELQPRTIVVFVGR